MVLRLSATVLSLAVLEDGRLASGSEDGRIKLWPKDGAGEPAVLSHGAARSVMKSTIRLTDSANTPSLVHIKRAPTNYANRPDRECGGSGEP